MNTKNLQKNIIFTGFWILLFPAVTFAAEESVWTTIFTHMSPIIFTVVLLYQAKKTAESLATGITGSLSAAAGGLMKVAAGAALAMGTGGAAILGSRAIGGIGQGVAGLARGRTSKLAQSLTRGGDRVTTSNRKFRAGKWSSPRTNPLIQSAAKATGMDSYVGSGQSQGEKTLRDLHGQYNDPQRKVATAREAAAREERTGINSLNEAERNSPEVQAAEREISAESEKMAALKEGLKEMKDSGLEKKKDGEDDGEYDKKLNEIKKQRIIIADKKKAMGSIPVTSESLGGLAGKNVKISRDLTATERAALEQMKTTQEASSGPESADYKAAMKRLKSGKVSEDKGIETLAELKQYRRSLESQANEKEQTAVDETANKWEKSKKWIAPDGKPNPKNLMGARFNPANWGGSESSRTTEIRGAAESLRNKPSSKGK